MTTPSEHVTAIPRVQVRRAHTAFGSGTLPYLRSRANEAVAGPEYLLTHQGDAETIWECVFRLVLRVPNRHVSSWAVFEPANESESQPHVGDLALRVSRWDTAGDLRDQTWRSSGEPTVNSRLGVFPESRTRNVKEELEHLDQVLWAGVPLQPRSAVIDWEELTFERTFSGGVIHLTMGREIGCAPLERSLEKISTSIELVSADSAFARQLDSIDIVFK